MVEIEDLERLVGPIVGQPVEKIANAAEQYIELLDKDLAAEKDWGMVGVHTERSVDVFGEFAWHLGNSSEPDHAKAEGYARLKRSFADFRQRAYQRTADLGG